MKIKLTKEDKRNAALIVKLNELGGNADPETEDTPERVVSTRLKFGVKQRSHQAARVQGQRKLEEIGLNPAEVTWDRMMKVGFKAIADATGVDLTPPGLMAKQSVPDVSDDIPF